MINSLFYIIRIYTKKVVVLADKVYLSNYVTSYVKHWTHCAEWPTRYPPLREITEKSLYRFDNLLAICDRNYKIKYNIYKDKIIKLILNKIIK